MDFLHSNWKMQTYLVFQFELTQKIEMQSYFVFHFKVLDCLQMGLLLSCLRDSFLHTTAGPAVSNTIFLQFLLGGSILHFHYSFLLIFLKFHKTAGLAVSSTIFLLLFLLCFLLIFLKFLAHNCGTRCRQPDFSFGGYSKALQTSLFIIFPYFTLIHTPPLLAIK